MLPQDSKPPPTCTRLWSIVQPSAATASGSGGDVRVIPTWGKLNGSLHEMLGQRRMQNRAGGRRGGRAAAAAAVAASVEGTAHACCTAAACLHALSSIVARSWALGGPK
jgi:hypothetical protein